MNQRQATALRREILRDKLEASRGAVPPVGYAFTNPWASVDNPHKHGRFVREVIKAAGVNRGIHWIFRSADRRQWRMERRIVLEALGMSSFGVPLVPEPAPPVPVLADFTYF